MFQIAFLLKKNPYIKVFNFSYLNFTQKEIFKSEIYSKNFSHEERAKFTNFSQAFGRRRHCGSFHVAFPRLVAPKILADSFEDLRGGKCDLAQSDDLRTRVERTDGRVRKVGYEGCGTQLHGETSRGIKVWGRLSPW